MLVAISDLGVEAFTVLPCPDIAVTEMQEYKAVLGIEILPEIDDKTKVKNAGSDVVVVQDVLLGERTLVSNRLTICVRSRHVFVDCR
jgi:hypothetical protein